jgi:hypothetical protein
LIVALGIVAHDLADGLNTMLLVTHGERPGRSEYFFLLADAFAPILGGGLVLASKLPPKGVALFLGLTSGFFLFTPLATCYRKQTNAVPISLCQ